MTETFGKFLEFARYSIDTKNIRSRIPPLPTEEKFIKIKELGEWVNQKESGMAKYRIQSERASAWREILEALK